MWDLSCPDWERRIREGRSLIPALDLFEDEAQIALEFFDALKLPDVQGTPLLGKAAGEWYREIVRTVFGALDPVSKQRMISEIFALVPKGQSKTTYSAGLMLTAMFMNERPRAEMLFVGPTQAISDRAYSQAVGMIEADPELLKRFKPREHLKEIHDLKNKAKLRVKTFGLDILTGAIPVVVLLDELHLLGRNAHASKVLRQIRGGIEKNPEGFLVIITTQSDEPPAGAFEAELLMAREIRNGVHRGQNIRALLPILYEYPKAIATDPEFWQNPDNWHMVMPNLGRSMRLDSLVRDWETERHKGPKERQIWASQHLNIEIGVGLQSQSWAGVEFWCENVKTGTSNVDQTLTLEEVIARSDVLVVGIDGGGLDDLLGLAVMGRESATGRWLLWCAAWAHEIVKDRRKSVAPKLDDLAEAGELTFVKVPGEDVAQIAELVLQVDQSGKLAGEDAIGVDTFGVAAIREALTADDIGIEEDRIVGIPQGWQLNGAIKTLERNLAGNTVVHNGSALMDFAVGNAKVEARGNAITITKQVSGSAKIDPLMAAFHATVLMGRSPEPAGASYLEDQDIIVL